MLENHQLNLFENENPKHKYLMKTIDYIQKKEGQNKIKLGSQDLVMVGASRFNNRSYHIGNSFLHFRIFDL